MKKFIKLSLGLLVSTNMFACTVFTFAEPDPSAVGAWENTLKNTDGSSVVTSIDIKETKIKNTDPNIKGFSATINSKIQGSESDTLKLTTKTINVSGTMVPYQLTITDVESETDSISTSSRFTLSKDGKYLTLQPGDIKFHKKDSK